MEPRLSLIITTYNRKDALELVLISALAQNDLPDEIIVADDGSRSDTRDLVVEYQQKSAVPIVHCWHEDTGFRLAAIRNRAIAMARYEYIVMIDGDIVLPRHFIKAHRENARPGYFLQGSRVILSEKKTAQVIRSKNYRITAFSSGIGSRFNALYIPALAPLFSFVMTDLKRTRGCNQSFWKSDVIKVNGFNEDFVGWGREDTEFMVRMLNNDIQCYKMKLVGSGFHLYHPEASRAMEPRNQQILDDAIARGDKRCRNGINHYLS